MSQPTAAVSPSRFLQLLADEQRWQLLRELARSDRKVGELTELVGRPQNLVSYHLAGLRNAGLVSSRRSSADGRDTYYRLDARRCGDLLSEVGSALQPALRLDVALPDASQLSARRKPTVLFLCTGNSTRSQMAEALLEHHSAGAIRARSAGSHPKPLHPNAVRVMAERGLDISEQKSKHLDRFKQSHFDRVITLCDRVREICPEFPTAANAHWSMPDPAEEGANDDGSYPAFVRTAEELESRIPFLIGELVLARKGENQ
ncbi:MAG TPA: metalloregulator ArsR/SmtB family transcription factor [Actinomycetota bacterium]|nr:metalloregulator ArsR/SmtB family transcription factor [Actinomycetota bacterium]